MNNNNIEAQQEEGINHAHGQLVQRPALQTRENIIAHPSLCNGNAYSQDLRRLVLFIALHVDEEDHNMRNMLSLLRHEHVYPSSVTERRWMNLYEQMGHVRPCRRSGNADASRMRGQDLVFLALYRVFYPKATISEINAFLYRCNLRNPFWNFYHPSQISRAETLIGLSRKRGSTTAHQALYPANIQKRWQYWNLPYPLGIADITRSKVIDLDECGVFLETHANRSYGKSYIGLRVREEGVYSKSEKWNLLLAVCGEDGTEEQAARRWADIWLEGGTTVDKMLEFIQNILDDIGFADEENFFVFTMDNLNSHKNVGVIALIHLYGHGVIYRAPYWALDGAIEFIFNTLQSLMRARSYEINNDTDLIAAIYESIQSIDSFASYFENIGFIRNE